MDRTGARVISLYQSNVHFDPGKWYRIRWNSLAPAGTTVNPTWRVNNNTAGRNVESDSQTWSAPFAVHEWVASSTWSESVQWIRIDPTFNATDGYAFVLRWATGPAVGEDLYLDNVGIEGPFDAPCVD